MSRTRLNSARRSVRTLLVVAMVATLMAAVPTTSYAAPGDSPRPTWPAAVTVAASNVTDTTATLTLSAPAMDADGIVAYNVYGGAGNTVLLGTSATTTINLTGLTAETAYTIHVEAVDADGISSEPLTGTNFSLPVSYSTGIGSSPYSIGLGQFNAGGDIDMVVANQDLDSVGVFLGNGDGTFGTVSQDSVGPTPSGEEPKNLAIGLLNADAHLDIVTANEATNTIAVLLGDGAGDFTLDANYPAPLGSHGVALGSFTAGTTVDIISVGWAEDVPEDPGPPVVPAVPNDGFFFSGDGDGTFTKLATEFADGASSHAIAVGDFDDAGGLDFAVADLQSAVNPLIGAGTGTFTPGPALDPSGQAHDIAVGNLNADSDEDFVVALQTTDVVQVFFGAAGTAFTDPEAAGAFAVADQPKGVSVGDVDNDGVDDIVAASVGTNIVEIGPNCVSTDNPVTLLMGNGTGGFANWTGSYAGPGGTLVAATAGQLPMGRALYDATVSDFNGDGWNDIAAPAFCDDEVVVRLGLGVGGPSATFTTTAAAATAPGAPAAPVATAGDATASVAWTAPASDGGSAITGYDLQVENLTTPGVTDIDAGLVLSRFLTGLTNDDSYRARVRATNAVGDGAWSAWSASFIPEAGAVVNPFTDTAGSVFRDDIIWLAGEGITKGCNPPTNDLFCPEDDVTRGQMAAFLVRALDLTDDGGGNKFVDDDGSIFEEDIAKLAAAGITKGCNPPANTNFCPDDEVTRGQMAAFMVRALGLTDDGGGNTFVDVPAGSVFENDIAKLATAGITKGCNPPANTNFCPDDNVTRGQMAAFMRRALRELTS